MGSKLFVPFQTVDGMELQRNGFPVYWSDVDPDQPVSIQRVSYTDLHT